MAFKSEIPKRSSIVDFHGEASLVAIKPVLIAHEVKWQIHRSLLLALTSNVELDRTDGLAASYRWASPVWDGRSDAADVDRNGGTVLILRAGFLRDLRSEQ